MKGKLYLHAVFLGQRQRAGQQAAALDHSESSLTTTRDALASTARVSSKISQGRLRSTTRDLLRYFRRHSRHHCDDTNTAAADFANPTTLYKPIRRRCGNLSCSDAIASLSMMPSRLPKIQIQIKFQILCNGLYCDDTAAPNAAMPPPLYR